MRKDHIKIAIVGHVDHGKSTLIGRLFYDTKSIPEEKITEIIAANNESNEIDFAFVMDHLVEERNKKITIDTAQAFFKSEKRNYIIIDNPGHLEFLKNMITGSCNAECAILVIDALEGISNQTKIHSLILKLLSIDHLIIAINKMDLINYDQNTFDAISCDIKKYLSEKNIHHTYIVPIAARLGDNIINNNNPKLSWYKGKTLLEQMDSLPKKDDQFHKNRSTRFFVQDQFKINKTGYSLGKLTRGILNQGQNLISSSTKTNITIEDIVQFEGEQIQSFATINTSSNIAIKTDLPLERGTVLAEETRNFLKKKIIAHIFWMDELEGNVGDKITIKCLTQKIYGTLSKINYLYDTRQDQETYDGIKIQHSQIAEVEVDLEKNIFVDDFKNDPLFGRFIMEKNDIHVAGGIISNNN